MFSSYVLEVLNLSRLGSVDVESGFNFSWELITFEPLTSTTALPILKVISIYICMVDFDLTSCTSLVRGHLCIWWTLTSSRVVPTIIVTYWIIQCLFDKTIEQRNYLSPADWNAASSISNITKYKVSLLTI